MASFGSLLWTPFLRWLLLYMASFGSLLGTPFLQWLLLDSGIIGFAALDSWFAMVFVGWRLMWRRCTTCWAKTQLMA